MDTFSSTLARFTQQIGWLSLLDILLVAGAFYAVLVILRGTQAVNLMRGVVVLIVAVVVLSGALRLRAISWLLRAMLPALLLAFPVIFQPEIRRALDRLGRAGTWLNFYKRDENIAAIVEVLVMACMEMSGLQQGALIVIERTGGLQEFVDGGVKLDAALSVALLKQIFHKDTPLHDGAVVLRGDRVAAAACVLPLAVSARVTNLRFGLRHRAALGISELGDAVAVVVSEETGSVSIVHNGVIDNDLSASELRAGLLMHYGNQSENGKDTRRNLPLAGAGTGKPA